MLDGEASFTLAPWVELIVDVPAGIEGIGRAQALLSDFS